MRKITGSVQKHGRKFRISYYDINVIRQYESFPTEEEAHAALAQRLAAIANGIPMSAKPQNVRFGELCVDVLINYQSRKLASFKDIEARYRLHIVPAFGEFKAVAITSSMVEHYIVRRRDEKAKEGTIARELEAIKRAFLLAKKTKPVKFLGEPPLIPRLKENPRSGFFTREEVDRLCRYLPHPLDKFTLFGFLTGWRKSEICRLDWANVDFRIGEFRVDTSKNGDPLVFAMTDELRDLLKSIWAPFGPVFQINGKPIKEFRKTWKTACYKAKLPCIVAPVKKGGKPGAVKVLKSLRIFHDLRRSAAREMDNQGVPRPITKSLMGHKTDQMFNRYRIVSESDKQMAIGTINGARNGAKRGMSNS